MALLYFFYIFQGKRAGCKIARIGVITFAFDDKLLEVGIGDDSLATNHEMSLFADGQRNTTDSWCQMRNVGANMTITASHHLG